MCRRLNVVDAAELEDSQVIIWLGDFGINQDQVSGCYEIRCASHISAPPSRTNWKWSVGLVNEIFEVFWWRIVKSMTKVRKL